MNTQRTYIAIDLKSFYASVECQERGLNALRANLVVADASRTEKTICLAVSPALKKMGISARPRLFEVVQKVNQINQRRMKENGFADFEGSSIYADELMNNQRLKVEYEVAPPRMALYMEYSTRIYQIYLQYVSAQDIHVYSIDEVFIDATDYLKLYHVNAQTFARRLIQDVLRTTGITATAGIAPNMFLCKCAMDIIAKRIPSDENGVRIATLDEQSFRRLLWTHQPLTDFWRIGRGTAVKLEKEGIYTMGDIARCSIGSFEDYYNEDLLFRLFGINAELLIDHAWGYEPCTMADIKAYKPQASSMGIGQVLHRPYTFEEAHTIVKEMADTLAMQLVDKKKVTDCVSLYIGYDMESLEDGTYQGDTITDFYGRQMPKPSGGSIHFPILTSSRDMIVHGLSEVYLKNIRRFMKIRRVNVAAQDIKDEGKAEKTIFVQQDLFSVMDEKQQEKKDMELQAVVDELKKERKAQKAILEIQKKYGKNVIMKGMSLQEEATGRERNEQIGGHKS